MLEELFSELSGYLDLMKNKHNLNISVHDVAGFTREYSNYLLPYNIHDCSYCMEIKSKKELWGRCQQQQKRVASVLNDKIIFGKCYAGVFEYTIPFSVNHKLKAFISIGGYRKEGFNNDVILKKYFPEKYKELKIEIPSYERVKKISDVILRYFKLIYSCTELSESYDKDSEKDYIYSHIIAYLNEHYMEDVTLSDISSFCHYSKSYISHMFKKKSGKSISEYINSIRIKEAKKLLKKTNKQIKYIAFEIGFSDSNYFTSTFKRETGLSPKEYRISR